MLIAGSEHLSSRDWLFLWSLNEWMPTRYDPEVQWRIDALYHRQALEAQGIPAGGATPLDPAMEPEEEGP